MRRYFDRLIVSKMHEKLSDIIIIIIMYKVSLSDRKKLFYIF